MRNHSYENDFDLHENETACRTHFHMKGFALRLVLKQRHKRTRKWPIALLDYFEMSVLIMKNFPQVQLKKVELVKPFYMQERNLEALFFTSRS